MEGFSKSTWTLYSAGLCILCLCVFVFGLTGCGEKKEGNTAIKNVVNPEKANIEKSTEVSVPSNAPITEERTYYDFETDLNGWEIPMWAMDKSDYVGKDAVIYNGIASSGDSSMRFTTDFPGGLWSAGLVEIQQYLNLSGYRVVKADIYLPEGSPQGLKAKMILTVGDNWKFVEMSRSVPLMPGEWATISANIEPGSYDWKRVVPDENFAEDVRKIAIRIESNRKPKYTGPIYIDNIRVGR